jgi:DNA-directed RNA polymerase II subunit RPB1
MDDKLVKKIFKYHLIDSLNIKKCIINLKLTKKHIDYISDNIIMNYNNSIVEPGDMVGVLGAQTLGEPATQMTISAFHNVGSGAGTEGVPRLLEIYGSSPNMKSPMMTIFFDDKYNKNEKYLIKITSNIINTSIKDIIDNIIIYYDENKSFDSKLMKNDRIINNIFSVSNPNKNSCINNINNLNWIIKIELNEEKMLSREITLLNIKTRICEEWENRFKDNKGSKKEMKKILFNKILQIALLSNSDNDSNPVIHIRFNIINYVIKDFIEFINIFIKEIQIKGINNITNVITQKPIKYNSINYDNDGVKEDYEYIIKTNGINMNEIFKIKGINLNKIYINDLREVERIYGIEAVRTLIINELIETYKNKGIDINYCHFSIFADIQISLGNLISLERHGSIKLKTSVLAKASFERPVDILVNAGLYGEVDNMKSVSSRIIGGLCFLGGSNLPDVAIDRELIENSEYTLNETIENKNINEVSNNITKEINENVFIPDLF